MNLSLSLSIAAQNDSQSCCPEAAAYFAALATTPPMAVKVLINNFIVALKAVNYWDSLDYVYLRANWEDTGVLNANSAAYVNLAQPAKYKGQMVNAQLSQTRLLGVAGDGTNGIDNNFTLTVAGARATQNSVFACADVQTYVEETGKALFGGRTGATNGLIVSSRYSASQLLLNVNTDTAVFPDDTFTTGLLSIIRGGTTTNAATKIRYAKEATLSAELDSNSVAVVNANIMSFGRNNTGAGGLGLQTAQTLSFEAMGAAPTNAQFAAFVAAYQAFRTALRGL